MVLACSDWHYALGLAVTRATACMLQLRRSSSPKTMSRSSTLSTKRIHTTGVRCRSLRARHRTYEPQEGEHARLELMQGKCAVDRSLSLPGQLSAAKRDDVVRCVVLEWRGVAARY